MSADKAAENAKAEQAEVEAFYEDADEFDPTASSNTSLDHVPNNATISFRSGRTRDTQLSFIIERAMLDPAAEVIPYNESGE
jgi:hypothetical protein